ncbi:MAG TPA: HlyD family type I secretion periplasmic adaptor subunit [Burkholderiales bacterium]|nr:HlyD family type I secretion periplasmic adaptor subunit [Burkholderiales bacterium]
MAEAIDSPRKLIHAGIAGVVLLVLAVAVWASLAPVSGAVIAPGAVKVDMYRRTVQHQEGGIVGEILVRDGSRVKAGDPLVILKDVKVEAGIELVLNQLDGELAKSARLQAEQAWAQEVKFPEELERRAGDPRVADVLRRERELFKTRREAYDSQLGLIRAQIRDVGNEIRARQAQIKADHASLRFQREELESNRKLLKDGFISSTRVMSLERGLADVEARLSEHEADLATARGKVSELNLKAENLRTTMMQEAANEQRQNTLQILDLRERLRPLQDASTRQRVVAPIGGEVVALKFTSVGTVIGPRDPILDIVPENIELVIEGRVRPEDINYVSVGADTDVRLTAFRQRITPVVAGTVIYVSADRIEDRNERTAYYVVHVRVTPEALAKAGDLKLQAGMPAELYIKTAARTALMYVLDPVTGFLQRSLREPLTGPGGKPPAR